MRKILAIFFTLLISANVTGMAIAKHYCGGHLMVSTITFGHEDLRCGMEEADKLPCQANESVSLKKESCCEDELSEMTTDTFTSKDLQKINIPIIAALTVVVFQFSISETDHEFINAKDSPPLLDLDLNVLYQTFLI